MISADNATRWNSTFLMVNDALNLHQAIDLFVMTLVTTQGMDKNQKKTLEQCTLGKEAWEELMNIHALLYEFWESTMFMQGNIVSNMPNEDEGKKWNSAYDHPGERLFRKLRCNEDGAVFDVLPTFDILLSKL